MKVRCSASEDGPVYHKPRWGLRGAVVGTFAGWLIAGVANPHRALVGAVVGALAVSIGTVLIVHAATVHEERLVEHDPKRAAWQRRQRSVVERRPGGRFAYWSPVGGDAPLTPAGKAEVLALAMLLVAGFLALAVWSFATR